MIGTVSSLDENDVADASRCRLIYEVYCVRGTWSRESEVETQVSGVTSENQGRS